MGCGLCNPGNIIKYYFLTFEVASNRVQHTAASPYLVYPKCPKLTEYEIENVPLRKITERYGLAC